MITKVIEIDVDELKAVGGLQNLDKAIGESEKQTASLKTQLREATAELVKAQEKYGEYSKAALDSAKKVALLKDQIQEAKETSQLFDPGAKFQAATGAISAGANAVQTYQAALGLLGVEGEAAQETLLKVQSAMALSQGLSGIADSAKDFQRLGAVAKQALAGIRTGIAATGIGLLVVALGAIVAYWDDIKEAVNGVSSEQEQLNKKSQANLESEKGKLDALSLQENSLRLQGKSEKEILKIKLAATDQVIKASEIQIEQSIATAKAQTEAAKRNQEILAGVIKFLSLPLTMILKTVDAVGKALGQDFDLEEKVFKGLASFVFDPKEVEAEGKKVVDEQKKALEKLKSDKDGLRLSIKNIDEQASKDAQANRQKEKEELQNQKDELKKIEENALKEIEDLKAKSEVEKVALQKKRDLEELDALKLKEEDKAKARKAIEDKYKILESEAKAKDAETKAIKDADKLAKDQEALIKKLELDKEFQNLTFEEQREILAKREAILTEDKTLTDEQRTKLEEDFANARISINEKEAQAKKLIFDKTSSILTAGADLLGKNTAAGKAMAVAASLINTYQGITTELATKTTTPYEIGLKIANVAVIAATGFKAVKNILATKVPGKGGGGSAPSGGGFEGGGGSAPSFNVVGNAGVNQIEQTLGSQQPIQAYVVASNVTTAQSMNRNIVENASLG